MQLAQTLINPSIYMTSHGKPMLWGNIASGLLPAVTWSRHLKNLGYDIKDTYLLGRSTEKNKPYLKSSKQ